MVGRILSMCFTAAAGIFLVALFVINRHNVRLVLDPIQPQDPNFALDYPFFIWMVAFLGIGILLGSAATMLSQGKWRRAARERTQEAMRWKSEAERLTRERDENLIERKKLLASN